MCLRLHRASPCVYMVLCGSTVTIHSLIKAVRYLISYCTLAFCYFRPLDKSKVLIFGTLTTEGVGGHKHNEPHQSLTWPKRSQCHLVWTEREDAGPGPVVDACCEDSF